MHTKDKTYSTFLSTKALLKELPEQFIQTHHSYVFNVNYFYKFENNDITLAIDNTRFLSFLSVGNLRRVFRRTSFPS
ncbi:LytTR family transcriptional regulator DNA-binding domain-containing protein [Streptococcus equi]|uniref:LytTR family transcriptional regulator DNA-binding domain-containing protein n=1 Tax=Streptococcus equi TaxID=1336 RepID=UPI001E5B6B8F